MKTTGSAATSDRPGTHRNRLDQHFFVNPPIFNPHHPRHHNKKPHSLSHSLHFIRYVRSILRGSCPCTQFQGTPVSVIPPFGRRAPPSHGRRTNQVCWLLQTRMHAQFDCISHSSSNLRPFTGMAFVGRCLCFQAPQKYNAYLTASASAQARDAAIIIRDVASAAPYNRGLSGSALRVNPASGPDSAPVAPRSDFVAGSPQTRVDHLVARLGAGLTATNIASAPQTNFSRSFLSPGGSTRTPSASTRPSEDSVPVSIVPSASGQDNLYLVESLSQPGLFTCHRSALVTLLCHDYLSQL